MTRKDFVSKIPFGSTSLILRLRLKRDLGGLDRRSPSLVPLTDPNVVGELRIGKLEHEASLCPNHTEKCGRSLQQCLAYSLERYRVMETDVL